MAYSGPTRVRTAHKLPKMPGIIAVGDFHGDLVPVQIAIVSGFLRVIYGAIGIAQRERTEEIVDLPLQRSHIFTQFFDTSLLKLRS